MTSPVEVVVARGLPNAEYSPSLLVLYGVQLVSLDTWIGKVLGAPQPLKVGIRPQPDPNRPTRAAIIYAFAYQAHCYHLPEPVILIVEGVGEDAMGYGFDQQGYRMWKVDKLDRTMQLEPTSDTYEEIVLKRALTGTKQPMSYASRIGVSHRGGKLSD